MGLEVPVIAPALIGSLVLALVTPELIRIDWTEHRLPNRLVGLAALGLLPGAVLAALTRPEQLTAAGLSAVAALLAYLLFAFTGGMGMGDVKLAAVLAFSAGLVSPVTALAGGMLAFVLGGIAAAVSLVARKVLGMGATRHRAPETTRGASQLSEAETDSEADAVPVAAVHRIAFGPWMLIGHWIVLVAAALQNAAH